MCNYLKSKQIRPYKKITDESWNFGLGHNFYCFIIIIIITNYAYYNIISPYCRKPCLRYLNRRADKSSTTPQCRLICTTCNTSSYKHKSTNGSLHGFMAPVFNSYSRCKIELFNPYKNPSDFLRIVSSNLQFI